MTIEAYRSPGRAPALIGPVASVLVPTLVAVTWFREMGELGVAG